MGLVDRLLYTLNVSQFQLQFLRHGHQMSTKWQGRQAIPKRRGLKCDAGEKVHSGRRLCTQTAMKFFPGVNVIMDKKDKTLIAIANGTIKISCERFDPNFDHPLVLETYSGRKNPRQYKKYIHVIPEPQHNQFKLIDVV